MKPWVKVIIFIIGAIAIAFNALLYNFCEKQKTALTAMNDQQKVDAKVNTNRFKYQETQIDHLNKDLADAQQQIKDQKDALNAQKDAITSQRDDNKSIQTSLVDIKAESDAIKQDMKGWQKDYVSVLAELEKKMDDSKDEIKSVKDNLDALNIPELKENINSLKADIEKMNHPPDDALPKQLPADDAKAASTQSQSQ